MQQISECNGDRLLQSALDLIQNGNESKLESFIDDLRNFDAGGSGNLDPTVIYQILRISSTIQDEDLMISILNFLNSFVENGHESSKSFDSEIDCEASTKPKVYIDQRLFIELKSTLCGIMDRFFSSHCLINKVLQIICQINSHYVQSKDHQRFDMNDFFGNTIFKKIKETLLKLCQSRRSKLVASSITCLATYGLMMRNYEESLEILSLCANCVAQCSNSISNIKSIEYAFFDMQCQWALHHTDRYSLFDKLIAFILPHLECSSKQGSSTTVVQCCPDSQSKWAAIGDQYLNENFEKYKERIEILEENQLDVLRDTYDGVGDADYENQKNPSSKLYLKNQEYVPNFGCKILIEQYGEKCLKSLLNDIRFISNSSNLECIIKTARIIFQSIIACKGPLGLKILSPLVYDLLIDSMREAHSRPEPRPRNEARLFGQILANFCNYSLCRNNLPRGDASSIFHYAREVYGGSDWIQDFTILCNLIIGNFEHILNAQIIGSELKETIETQILDCLKLIDSSECVDTLQVRNFKVISALKILAQLSVKIQSSHSNSVCSRISQYLLKYLRLFDYYDLAHVPLELHGESSMSIIDGAKQEMKKDFLQNKCEKDFDFTLLPVLSEFFIGKCGESIMNRSKESLNILKQLAKGFKNVNMKLAKDIIDYFSHYLSFEDTLEGSKSNSDDKNETRDMRQSLDNDLDQKDALIDHNHSLAQIFTSLAEIIDKTVDNANHECANEFFSACDQFVAKCLTPRLGWQRGRSSMAVRLALILFLDRLILRHYSHCMRRPINETKPCRKLLQNTAQTLRSFLPILVKDDNMLMRRLALASYCRLLISIYIKRSNEDLDDIINSADDITTDLDCTENMLNSIVESIDCCDKEYIKTVKFYLASFASNNCARWKRNAELFQRFKTQNFELCQAFQL